MKNDTPQKPLHFDFIYVVHDKETFADKQYKKWLRERKKEKSEQSKENTQ